MQTDPVGYGDGINWYRYCGNNPGNWGDPSGLTTIYIAFYDGADPGDYDRGIANGAVLREAADDWSGYDRMTDELFINLDMSEYGKYGYESAPEYIVASLAQYRDWDYYIAGVWFFDHCGSTWDSLQFGDTTLTGKDLWDFCGQLKEAAMPNWAISPITTFHFRHCWVAQDYGKKNGGMKTLKALAEALGGPATGFTQRVVYNAPRVYDPTYEPDGPDYFCNFAKKIGTKTTFLNAALWGAYPDDKGTIVTVQLWKLKYYYTWTKIGGIPVRRNTWPNWNASGPLPY